MTQTAALGWQVRTCPNKIPDNLRHSRVGSE